MQSSEKRQNVEKYNGNFLTKIQSVCASNLLNLHFCKIVSLKLLKSVFAKALYATMQSITSAEATIPLNFNQDYPSLALISMPTDENKNNCNMKITLPN